MAAMKLDCEDVKKQELCEMITCCICTEVYNNPIALPCIHTFCMKCLQETGLTTKKGPGDEMPCPICRRMFKIPLEGFRELPKNFFIQNLIQVSNVSVQSTISRCDVCLEENKEGIDSGQEIPTAVSHCEDCNQKFCQECCKQHRKFKSTKNHKMTSLTGQIIMKTTSPVPCSAPNPTPRVIDANEEYIQNVYCADCRKVVSAMCFFDDHRNHNGSRVDKCVSDFRKQIQDYAEIVNECRTQAEKKKVELLKVKNEIQECVEHLEGDIERRKDELKQCTDKHADSLLQILCSLRQIKLKENQLMTDDIETYLSSIDTYNSYCKKITAEGSDSDICRAFSDLSARAIVLQLEQSKPTCMLEGRIQPFNVGFRKSELEEILEESCDNWIGEIEVGDLKPKKRRQVLLAEQSKEIDFLRNENKELRQKLGMVKIAELRYIADPVFVQTIRTKAAQEEKKPILGLAILDKELFAVSDEVSDVEVFDSITLSFIRRMHLKELIYPLDIASCTIRKCLFIFDGRGRPSKILRIDPNGRITQKWPTGGDWGRLSVTYDSNVMFIDFHKNRLDEYSLDGKVIRCINLSAETGLKSLLHAVKLTNDRFVISHGYPGDKLHRVCIIDAAGRIEKTFGSLFGSDVGRVNFPNYLLVDGNGFLMVVDQVNSRVLLFDLDLNFKRELLSKEKHGLRRPSRVVMDESNGRLFATDNEFDEQRKIYSDGRIAIADLR